MEPAIKYPLIIFNSKPFNTGDQFMLSVKLLEILKKDGIVSIATLGAILGIATSKSHRKNVF